MKILVVENDELLAEALTAILTNQNYAVEVATDGDAAWDLIEIYDYDLILLDILLPKLDGLNICRRIRSIDLQTPVLLLTGRDSSHDKAIGLDAGADDYMVKPFDEEELVARVRALLRRGGARSQPVLEWESLRLDPSRCEVMYAQNLLSLTPKEYAILELFLRNTYRLFSCEMILEHIWSYDDTPTEEAVRTHIKGLRQKLKAVGAPSDLIETVYGIGYRLKPRQKERGVGKCPKSAVQNLKSQQQQTLTAVAGIWERFQGRVDEQVRLLEQAAAFSPEAKNSEWRSRAVQQAHSLAGSLGTFGLATGSGLARKIEQLLKSNKTLTLTQTNNLHDWIKLLRQEIAGKKNEVVSSPPLMVDSQRRQQLRTHDSLLVIVCDDELAINTEIQTLLEQGEYQVVTLANAQEAIAASATQHPDIIVLVTHVINSHSIGDPRLLQEAGDLITLTERELIT